MTPEDYFQEGLEAFWTTIQQALDQDQVSPDDYDTIVDEIGVLLAKYK